MLRWNALGTKDKLRVARVLYRGVAALRRSLRRPMVVRAIRRGVTYELDLAEGIDLAMYLLGAFEPDTYRALRRLVKPGQTVIDIGANSGVHSLPMAALVGESGRVIAFEPTSPAFDRLRRNIALNPTLSGRITAVRAYLRDGSDPSEVPSFYSSWRLDWSEAQHPKHFGSLADAAGAASTTLDAYLGDAGIERVDLIKIDVDGYEGKVLRGARRTLERDQPTLIVELCPYALEEQGDSADTMLGLLLQHRYAFFDERTGRRLPDLPEPIKASIGRDSSINLVAMARP
jgi:FkbM family methyltransferase